GIRPPARRLPRDRPVPHHVLHPEGGSGQARVHGVPPVHVDGLRGQVVDVANPLWNPWINDRGTFDLYRRRCRREAEEMTCAAQAAEILAERVASGETLLDAGCAG